MIYVGVFFRGVQTSDNVKVSSFQKYKAIPFLVIFPIKTFILCEANRQHCTAYDLDIFFFRGLRGSEAKNNRR